MKNYDNEGRGVKDFFNQTGLYLHKRFGIQLRREIIGQLISSESYKNVLDVGCGDGTLVLDFVKKADRIWMIDLSENMLGLAKKNIETLFPEEKEKMKYYNGDFIFFEGEPQFDLILVIGVLAHVTDLEAVFLKLKKLLKPNGILVIQYSDSDHLIVRLRHWWHRMHSKYALNRINSKLIGNLCASYNFSVVVEKRFNFPFFGMKYLSDQVLFKLQYWLMNRKWFSFILSDVILVLKRV